MNLNLKKLIMVVGGLIVLLVLVVLVQPWQQEAPAVHKSFSKTSSHDKVLLIGLDGADWNMIKPMVAEGKLPTFRHLLEEGSYGTMRSPRPLLSPIIWTTIATGKGPEKHGVFDFFAIDEKTGMNIPITSNSRAVKTLWHILSDRGLTTSVIGWRVTWPAERINGYIVSNRLTESEFDSEQDQNVVITGITYPDTLLNLISELVVSQKNIGYEQFSRFVDMSKQEFLTSLQQKTRPIFPATFNIAETETFKNIVLKLQLEKPTDFTAVYFKSIDWFGHLFAYHQKTQASSGKFNQAIREIYIYLDEILGEILQNVDEHTSVIVISDHGFKTAENGPHKPSDFIHGYGVADWHNPDGIVLLWGNKFKKHRAIEEVRPVDITPTVLFLMGAPVAMDMEGRILEEAIRPDNLSAHPVQYVQSFESNEDAGSDKMIYPPQKENANRSEITFPSTSASPYSYNNRGLIFMNKGTFAEAAAAFEEAIRRQADVPAFYDNLGTAYNALGKHEEAITQHEKAISLDRNFEKAYNNLGNAYSDLGQFEQARQAYEAAIELNPGFALPYSNLGNLYFKHGHFDTAERLIKKSLELDPKSALSYYNLGVVYGQQGRPAQAIEAFKKVPELDPYFLRMAEVYNNLGVAYFTLHRYEDALQEFQVALKLDPSLPDLHSRLGLVYLSMGNLEKAKEELRKELNRNPGNEAVKNTLEELDNSVTVKK